MYMRAVSTHIVFRLHLCRDDDVVVVGFVVNRPGVWCYMTHTRHKKTKRHAL